MYMWPPIYVHAQECVCLNPKVSFAGNVLSCAFVDAGTLYVHEAGAVVGSMVTRPIGSSR